MNEIETLLKAINLASYEGIKEVTVSVNDLLSLRGYILALNDDIARLKNDNNIINAKLCLRDLEKPTQLRMYA